MKERPIIFNDDTARAILDGSKTQMRKPVNFPLVGPYKSGKARRWTERDIPEINQRLAETRAEYVHHRVPTPYGLSGDRLWVRETFRLFDSSKECSCYDDCYCSRHHGKPIYRADQPDDEGPWRPSVHMPREHSRITLEIIAVRAERLHDISGPDCWAEGIDFMFDCEKYGSTVECFAEIWDRRYSTTNYAWAVNPLVWVVEFRRVQP